MMPGERTRGRRLALLLGAIVVLLAAGAVIAMRLWPERPADVVAAETPEMLALGEAVYGQACASCHGASLQGQPDWRTRRADGRLPAPPHDESGHTWHHPDEQLFAITKYGPAAVAGLDDYKTDMPAFDGVLSDRQIRAVLAYIKSTWPAEIRARQDSLNRQASSN